MFSGRTMRQDLESRLSPVTNLPTCVSSMDKGYSYGSSYLAALRKLANDSGNNVGKFQKCTILDMWNHAGDAGC